jgi:hypothetical protein
VITRVAGSGLYEPERGARIAHHFQMAHTVLIRDSIRDRWIMDEEYVLPVAAELDLCQAPIHLVDLKRVLQQSMEPGRRGADLPASAR